MPSPSQRTHLINNKTSCLNSLGRLSSEHWPPCSLGGPTLRQVWSLLPAGHKISKEQEASAEEVGNEWHVPSGPPTHIDKTWGCPGVTAFMAWEGLPQNNLHGTRVGVVASSHSWCTYQRFWKLHGLSLWSCDSLRDVPSLLRGIVLPCPSNIRGPLENRKIHRPRWQNLWGHS